MAAANDFRGMRTGGEALPANAAAMNAPIMMAMFITEVMSAKTDRASALCWNPPRQKALDAGSQPKAAAALAGHKVNPQTIDQG